VSRRGSRRGGLAALALAAVAAGVVVLGAPWERGGREQPEGRAAARATPRTAAVESREAAPRAGAARRAGGVVPGADGRLRIPVADQVPWRLPAEGPPSGWTLKEFAGRALVELVPGPDAPAIRLRSERSSFVLYRDVLVDLDDLPVLTWSWSVVRLPAGGDVRQRSRDDQAAQVYVVFPRWPAPATSSDVIGYVWDTTAPAGTRLPSVKAPNVRIIVLRSGPEGLGAWHSERRNVREDYLALFGRQPPRVGSVAVMIDADDTGGVAEALVTEIEFSRS